MTNRLANELSPYLLQHAENPVDWYPWGEEAFARSRQEEKPIFLSVGYSTCHWCHVMERESFENDDVAALLNQHFVSIKVDREERPDVDRVYMAFVQATTGAGGWPMSVWLTPDLKPFFGGTYFPPTSRYGRPGFTDVLARMAQLWSDERGRLVQSADDLVERLRQIQGDPPTDPGPIAGTAVLGEGVAQFEQAFDARFGGFGGAPKFPRPSELLFLLREHVRSDQVRPLEMVTQTLRAMADGGLRDHVGGGFHRYSVDAQWRIPHFEKMLYDQAQLVVAYVEGGQATGDRRFFDVVRDTLAYAAEELTDAGGGFWSAQDADSIPPGQANSATVEPTEGAFYLWTQEELEAVLGDDTDLVAQRYGVEANGNALHDPTGEFVGLNHFYLARTIEDLAAEASLPAADVESRLAKAREALKQKRAGRPSPHLDDKVLTAWNGLMIGAAARAARVIEDDGVKPLEMAVAAARFVRQMLWEPDRGVLKRRYRDGRSSIDGYCEDYAFMVWGLLELFQADGDPGWLQWARELQRRQDDLFWDEGRGGWFSTTGEDPSVLLRVKDDYDGAEPSAGSVSVLNLITLTHLEHDDDHRRRIEAALVRLGSRLGARVVPLMAAALGSYHRGLSQVVIVGPAGRSDTDALKRIVAGRYLPFAVQIPVNPGPRQEELGAHLPFVKSMSMVDDAATAYVCSGFACQEPTTDPARLDEQLRALSSIRQ